MERGRSLFIFKVKYQGHWTFIKKILALGSMWARYSKNYNAVYVLKFGMYTSYGSGRSLFIKFKITMSLSSEIHKTPVI